MDFDLYEKLWKQRASKHMANMTISEVASWLNMSLDARGTYTREYYVRSALAVCQKYLEEMRNTQNY